MEVDYNRNLYLYLVFITVQSAGLGDLTTHGADAKCRPCASCENYARS